MKKFLIFCCFVFAASACQTSETQETPVSYKLSSKNLDKPIVPVPNDGSFFGKISFDQNNKIYITLPDSSEIIAEQVSATTRNYFLKTDKFLIFSTKNYENGFRIFSNDNKALWKISLKKAGIEVHQQGINDNKFEISMQKQNLLLQQKGMEIGKAVLENGKAVFYKKDKQLFTIQTDAISPAFGILLIDEMGIEEKYAIFAETIARGY